MIFYGPPGVGKTTCINKIAEDYTADHKTLVAVWPTDKFEAYQVKDFIKSFNYVGVEKMILIIEDLGGVEIDQVRMKSDSSLLSLLDNQEKTFKVPVLILATTNFIEIFMGNLTNRPGRFDDKIEVGYPSGEYRKELLRFFTKNTASTEALDLINSQTCKEFSTAHIKEIMIRSAIYEKDMVEVIKELSKEIDNYNKAFTKSGRMGISSFDD